MAGETWRSLLAGMLLAMPGKSEVELFDEGLVTADVLYSPKARARFGRRIFLSGSRIYKGHIHAASYPGGLGKRWGRVSQSSYTVTVEARHGTRGLTGGNQVADTAGARRLS